MPALKQTDNKTPKTSKKIEKISNILNAMLAEITRINEICKKHDLKSALQDEVLYAPAIMFGFDIIYWRLNNLFEIKTPIKFIKNILELDSLERIEDLGYTSIHHYKRLDFDLVEAAIKNDLPKLKNELKIALENLKGKKLDKASLAEDVEYKKLRVEWQIRATKRKIKEHDEAIKELQAMREWLIKNNASKA